MAVLLLPTMNDNMQNPDLKPKELHKRAVEPLSTMETVEIAICGFVSLFTLIWIIPKALRFKSSGFLLKYQKTKKVYWTAFGIKFLSATIIFIAVFLYYYTKHKLSAPM